MSKLQNWIKRIILVSLPIALFGVISEIASWRPKTLQVLPELAKVESKIVAMPKSLSFNMSETREAQAGKQILIVEFSPDRQFVVTAVLTTKLNAPLRLWNAQDGQPLATLVHSGSASDGLAGISPPVVFSPDGKLVAATFGSYSDWNDVQLWDGRTGKLLRVLKGHQAAINLLAFTPDGKYIVSRSRQRDYSPGATASQQPGIVRQSERDVILQMRVQ